MLLSYITISFILDIDSRITHITERADSIQKYYYCSIYNGLANSSKGSNIRIISVSFTAGEVNNTSQSMKIQLFIS